MSVNDPNISGDCCEFKIKVQTKRSLTIGDLKVQLSEMFGIEVDKMIVKKNAQQGELKGMTSKLAELDIIDGDLIRVERGVPHKEEIFEVHAVIVNLVDGTSPSDEHTNDEKIF